MTDNWIPLFESVEFSKWGYRGTPYRVIADMDKKRGHYRVLFTSVYPGDSYLVAGNLGGGIEGYAKAKQKAQEFFEENKYGCPPPGEYANA